MTPDMQVPRHAPWPRWKRVAFRFAFSFWVLWDNGLWLVLWVWPWLRRHVGAWLDWPMTHLTLWTGKHVFHLSGVAATFHPTGSGDTALGWTQQFCTVVVALVVCAVWSAVSETRARRHEYYTLYAWLRLGMRFILAATLFSYGFEKVFPLQMPPPSPTTLAETYGASSPMRLAWTFLGASWQYRIFAGLAEVIPAVLLCFRRTSTLGALGAAAVMLNVFMMNIGYDIPVKLYSMELLLMSLFLLLPDFGPLWRVFVARKEAALTGVWVRKPERRALRIAGHLLQVAVIGFLLQSSAWSSWKSWRDGKTPLKGSWTVASPVGGPADEHWNVMEVRSANFVVVRIAGKDKPDYDDVKTNVVARSIEFFKEDDNGDLVKPPYATFHWRDGAAGVLLLDGMFNGKPASMTWTRMPEPPGLLMTRGFHWVQEYPLNK
jgi:hypothetical protein